MATPLFCTYCGKKFNRSEHLDRHILTHTNVKPFKCDLCHLSFNRQDLVRRHVRLVHEESDEPDIGGGNRTPIACTNCAKAKTKCDKETPCTRCKSRGTECIPRPSRHTDDAAHKEKKRKHEQDRASQLLHKCTIPSPESSEEQKEDSESEPTQSVSLPHTMSVSPAITIPQSTSDLSTDSLVTPPYHLDTPMFDLCPPQLPMANMTNNFHNPNSDFLTQQLDTQTLPYRSIEDFDTLMPPWNDMSATMANFEFDPTLFRSTNPMHQDGRLLYNTPRTSGNGTPTSCLEPNLPDIPMKLIPESTLLSISQEHQPLSSNMDDPDIGRGNRWPGFSCNPPVNEQKSAKKMQNYLENLTNVLQGRSFSSSQAIARTTRTQTSSSTIEPVIVEAFEEHARQNLSLIIRTLILKALEEDWADSIIHDRSPIDITSIDCEPFMPCSETLSDFLQTYASHFEPYYNFTANSTLNPNEMIDSNDKKSPLLLILMIAQGAMVSSNPEAWCLSSVLAEACRVSFRDPAEGERRRFHDVTMLRSVLCTVDLTAWSGDPWHMNTAMSQWPIYVNCLKETGILNYQEVNYPQLSECSNVAMAFEIWQESEIKSRLVYAWVGTDLEISIFFETPPKLSIADLNTVLPTRDRSHQSHSKSVDEFLQFWERICGSQGSDTASINSPSFNALFRLFLEREIGENTILTPRQLQLLLHGLQGLASHLYECLVSFYNFGSKYYMGKLTTTFGTQALLQELKSLLQNDWYALYKRSMQKYDDTCFSARRTLILYHLMSARVLLSFAEIEKLARSEPSRACFEQSPLLKGLKGRLIEEQAQIKFHCGQVFRLVRIIPWDKRPLWWSAAIYRATLLLWVTSMATAERHHYITSRPPFSHLHTVAIDQIDPEDDLIGRYLRCREGIPVLTAQNGESVPLTIPDRILARGLEILSSEESTRFSEGISSRLRTLRQRWKNAY